MIFTMNRRSNCEAVSLENNDLVVVKVFDKLNFMKISDPKEKKRVFSIQNEINILRSHECPYIVQMREIYESKKTIHLIFEQLVGGDLHNRFFLTNKFNFFKENNIKLIMRQLLLQYNTFIQKISCIEISSLRIFFFIWPNMQKRRIFCSQDMGVQDMWLLIFS